MTEEKKRVLVLAIGPTAHLVQVLSAIERAGLVQRPDGRIETEVVVVPYPHLPMQLPSPPIVEDFSIPFARDERMAMFPPRPSDVRLEKSFRREEYLSSHQEPDRYRGSNVTPNLEPPPMLPLEVRTRPRGPNLSKGEQRRRQMQHARKR